MDFVIWLSNRILFGKNWYEFQIEFYPLLKKYAVKHKHGWLKLTKHTGVMRIESLFEIVDLYDTVYDAEKAIADYKEHQLKSNVKIVKTIK